MGGIVMQKVCIDTALINRSIKPCIGKKILGTIGTTLDPERTVSMFQIVFANILQTTMTQKLWCVRRHWAYRETTVRAIDTDIRTERRV